MSAAAVHVCQTALDAFVRKHFSERTNRKRNSSRESVDTSSAPDADRILAKAQSGKNGGKIHDLYFDGDWQKHGYPSQSEADLALCSMLAFYVGPDSAALDRLFRGSALAGKKWDRDDYREATLSMAIAGCADFYQWSGERQTNGETGTRPEIEVTTDEFIVNAEAVEALSRDPAVFQRGGSLVHIIRDAAGELSGIKRPADSPQIVSLPYSIVRERLTEQARFVKWVKRGDDWAKERAHPPDWCVKAVADRGQWRKVRKLTAIIETPMLLANGKILATPGYDRSSGLLLEARALIPTIPDRPTAAQVNAARDLLLDLIADFPFERRAHQAAWVAYLLTALSRFSFQGPAPLFLADANVRGSGKTLLCSLVGQITTGRELPRMSNPRDDEECRKRITALAIAGDPLVLIDNIHAELGCASLDAALTGSVWRDRILGRSEIVTVPLHVTWAASGNNIILRADTSRRVCPMRLDSRMENPEDRDGFQYPEIERHAADHRMEYVAAALTILRGYFAAGCPDQKLRPWGSFEGWSAVPRSAVVWCGLDDPGETRQELREQSDRDAMALRVLLNAWRGLAPEGLTAGAALKHMIDGGHEHLVEAVVELCNPPSGKMPTSRSLGNKLKSVRRRVCEGLYLDSFPGAGGYKVWRVYDAAVSESCESSDSSQPRPTRTCARVRTRDSGLEDSPDSPDSPSALCQRCDDVLGPEGTCPTCASW